VGSLAGEWHPEKYKDEYRENLMRIIDAKVKGKSPKLTEEAAGPGRADVVDLMERLRKSLDLSQSRSGGAKVAKTAKMAKAGASKTSKAVAKAASSAPSRAGAASSHSRVSKKKRTRRAA
jgi:DNA end-binding protein Ku